MSADRVQAQSAAAPHHLLVFGASGAIGSSIRDAALAGGWRVTAIARRAFSSLGAKCLALDPFAADFGPHSLAVHAPFDAVCWAQGANCNDSVYDVDLATHMDLYRANVAYILVTLRALLDGELLATGGARLCVISSIWQQLARQTKLSYCVSKAALEGLVLSASADLARDSHLINAVLPGALDTPMTRRNLTPEQLAGLTTATGFGRLPQLADVASLVLYLTSPANTGITGQFIAADLGFSRVRIV